ncbi:ectoine/hydroxyectoine ABC transporter permease subunit EhuC [Paenibacillus sp. YYML68]|uniref:ectoine/hydroxyectoine ABC transporter permease subunit EhuC n=1 Tax=Paenibacillus sp. YYML68 TaxID=2909250 RepID=UPI0024908E73|nr:ectoine/hydroxyectoine ABC transporter permease subunit EhuC [Paenibacillus sp. YYML68]
MPTSWLDFIPLFGEGLQVTVLVAALASVVTLVVSLLAGLARLSPYRLVRGATGVYVEVFRGSSLLVQLFWLYYALPFLGVELPKLAAAVLAVGLNYGAYGSEIVRSTIQAIPKGQWEASVALNLSPMQRMVRIILPQAFTRMIPPLGNLMIELLKSTSLVYFITLTDLTYQAMVLRNNYVSFTPEILLMLLVMYFVLATAISFGMRALERKMTAGRA